MRYISILTILLATLVPHASQAQAEPQLDPAYITGDALYDRMQLEVLQEHGAELRLPGWTADMVREYNWAWAPRSSVVEGWEDEFAARSDYWCLLMYCRRQESAGHQPDLALLQRAADCSDAPQALQRMLMHYELREIRNDESLNASQQDSATDAVIERYLAKFPGSAWPCYEAADHLAWFGNTARFVELLEHGNSLAQLDEVSIFPYSFLLERMHSAAPDGSPAVAGSLLRSGAWLPTLEFARLIQRRDVYKNLIVGGTELGMERGLTALMRRDLLDSAASGLPLLCGGANASLVTLPSLLADYSEWPDPAQAAGVERFLADIAAFQARMQSADERLQQFDPELADYARNIIPAEFYEMYDVKQMGLQPPPEPELPPAAEAGRRLEALKQLSPALANMQEYALQQYLIEREVPVNQAMLRHLATFDFEHPENYVALEPVAAGDASP